MTTVSKAFCKMVSFCEGSFHDINHFIRVYGYAKTIGEQEQLDPFTQETLELAAIAHDIACPRCMQKYGCCAGYYQQVESEPLVKEFYAEFNLPQDQLNRILFLITHHHTYRNVEGLDYQILLEADYLVNCEESDKYKRNYAVFKNEIFKTKTGRNLLAAKFEGEYSFYRE